jgi:hypothetical protein
VVSFCIVTAKSNPKRRAPWLPRTFSEFRTTLLKCSNELGENSAHFTDHFVLFLASCPICKQILPYNTTSSFTKLCGFAYNSDVYKQRAFVQNLASAVLFFLSRTRPETKTD